MIGMSVGRYRVLSRLGEGGMATVWKARDELLGRTVALKILSDALARTPNMRRRFLDEARTGSQLEHPGVAAVYDFGESGGLVYIAFAFVDGETLAQRLARGPLEIAEAVRIVADVAATLGYAHARGVVHRDVTSRNVMLAQGGRVVLLDFGLALAADLSRHTESQDMLGTVPYLAPEVAKGRRADARSDVYGLGVVLFEALTGTLPFAGERTAAMIYSIVHTAAPAASSLRPEIAPELDHVIARALAKDPDARPADGAALAIELLAALGGASSVPPAQRSAAPPPVPAPPTSTPRIDDSARRPVPQPGPALAHRSLAVLPFHVLTDDPVPGTQQRLFAEGLTETLTASLARVPGLHVFLPSDFGDPGPPAGQSVAHARGADLVVNGSVRQEGVRVRVEYAIAEGAQGVPIASGGVDGSLTSGFELEDRLFAAIVGALGFDAAALPRPWRPTPRDPAAHAHYLQALGYLQRYDHQASVDGAIALLERLLETEGGSATLHATLGRAYLHAYRLTHERQWEGRAASECEHAIALDPLMPEVLLTLAEVHHATGRYPEAVAACRQALELRRDSVEAWVDLSSALEGAGDLEGAERAARQAIELRPGNWIGHNRLGVLCFRQGRFEEAIAEWRRVIERSPDNARGWYNLGGAFFHLERYDEALDAYRRSVEIHPTASAYTSLGSVLFHLRRHADAVAAFEQGIALRPSDPVTWGHLGVACRRMPGAETRGAQALDHAIVLVTERLERNPNDAAAWVNLANWLANRERVEEAERAMERGLSLAPGDVRAMAAAAVLHLELETRAATPEDTARHRTTGVRWLGEAIRNGYRAAQLVREPEVWKRREEADIRSALESAGRPGDDVPKHDPSTMGGRP